MYIRSDGDISAVEQWVKENCEENLDFIMGFLQPSVELDKPEDGDEPRAPWYHNESTDIFWPNYKKLLQSKGDNWLEAVESIESTTFTIMNQLPNPDFENDKFTGLIIGDVQSGKTAHFTGLMARAVDKGYNFVIVLSGIYNNLRYQTQTRVEEELLTNPFLLNTHIERFISLTQNGEFNGSADLRPFIEPDFSKIAIAVTKKNTDSLRALRSWLKSIPDDNRAKLRLLVIDDEADFATLNTTNPNEPNSTTINSCLRSIINQFPFSAYIGYTATPYANLVIQKSMDGALFDFGEGFEEELGLTLYPRNMIVKINPSQHYRGIDHYFGSSYDPRGPFQLIPTDEDRRLVSFFDNPRRENIPQSLKEALIEFVLVHCIRKKIEEAGFENKMMIHTIRATQDMLPIAIIVQQMFEHWGNYRKTMNVQSDEYYQILSDIWEERFSMKYSEIVSLSEIEFLLRDTLREIKFVVLNQSTRSTIEQGFESSLQAESIIGRPTVVVGGDLLSRGITIDGLTISYFARNSDYYDSLFQMGRWFGYPKTHFEFHRVYLFEECLDKFRFLNQVNLDIEQEVREYRIQLKTPIDFSPRVLLSQNIIGFLPSSSEKFASAEEYTEQSIVQGSYELPRIPVTQTNQVLNNIFSAIELLAERGQVSESFGSLVIREIPRGNITKLLLGIESFMRIDEVISTIDIWLNQNDVLIWNLIFYSPPYGTQININSTTLPNPLRIVTRNPLIVDTGIEDIPAASYLMDIESHQGISDVLEPLEQKSTAILSRSGEPPLIFFAIVESNNQSSEQPPLFMSEIILSANGVMPGQLLWPYYRLRGTFSSGRY